MSVIGAANLRRQLDLLSKESERTALGALRDLAFRVRDQVAADAGNALQYSGDGTRRFVAGGFKIKYRTQGTRFEAEIYPLPKSAAVLQKHVAAWTNRPTSDDDLVIDGKIAVPVGRVTRTKSGKVPARYLPARLLQRDARGRNRGFITKRGNVLMLRERSGQAAPAFVLRNTTTQPARIDVKKSAERAITRNVDRIFYAAIVRAKARAGVR